MNVSSASIRKEHHAFFAGTVVGSGFRHHFCSWHQELTGFRGVACPWYLALTWPDRFSGTNGEIQSGRDPCTNHVTQCSTYHFHMVSQRKWDPEGTWTQSIKRKQCFLTGSTDTNAEQESPWSSWCLKVQHSVKPKASNTEDTFVLDFRSSRISKRFPRKPGFCIV